MPPDPRRPASTVRVLGLVTAIAVGVVALTVAVPRLLAARQNAAAGTTEAIPTTLAGGMPLVAVPPAVQATVTTPVVGTQRSNVLPGNLDPQACAEHIFPGATSLGITGGYVVPEAAWVIVQVSFEQPDAPTLDSRPVQTVACVATADDNGNWELRPERSTQFERSGSSWSCCSDGLGTAASGHEIPRRAAWALLDQGTHHLAFDVQGTEWLPLMQTYPDRFMSDGPPPRNLLWLTNDGEIVAEESL